MLGIVHECHHALANKACGDKTSSRVRDWLAQKKLKTRTGIWWSNQMCAVLIRVPLRKFNRLFYLFAVSCAFFFLVAIGHGFADRLPPFGADSIVS